MNTIHFRVQFPAFTFCIYQNIELENLDDRLDYRQRVY